MADPRAKRASRAEASPPSVDEGGFFGRAAELARLDGLLANEGALVTLVGPPGVGKTRLARELVKGWDRDVALLCDLSEARTKEEMLVRFAEALRIASSRSARSARSGLHDQVGEALAERGGVLFVVDNVEQLIEAAAPEIAALRQAARGARWLVTSREPLGILGEWQLEVAPLSTDAAPDAGEPAGAAVAEGSGGGDSDAVRMLCDRIARARSMELPARERAVLPRIAARLDGLPLALELAASRIAAVGAAAVEARLEQQLSVLTRGPRDLDRRQRTLREAISWSWQLLGPSEQQALARLSIFRGGFDLLAAEAVLGEPSEPGEGDRADRDALDLVSVLRQKSLLYTRLDDDGAVRFGLYLSIREFASGELTASEAAAARHRHAHYFAELVESGATPAQLLVERDNLFAAIERCLEQATGPAMDLGARLLIGFGRLVDRTPIEPYLEHLESFLAAAPSAELTPHVRCWVQAATARCMRRLARMREAKRLYADALALSRAIGDRPSQAHLHGELGMVSFFENRTADALAQWQAATALYRELGDEQRLAITQMRHGMILRECGRLLEARAVQMDALERLRRLGEEEEVSISLSELAQIHTELDELDDSARRLEEAAKLAPERRTLLSEAAISGRSALLAWARGDLEGAQVRAQRTLVLLARVGYRRFEAGLLSYLGISQLTTHGVDAARAMLTAGRQLFGSDPRGNHLCGAWLAFLAVLDGDRDEAARQFATLPPLPRDDPFAVTSALLRLSLEVEGAESVAQTARQLGEVVLATTARTAAEASFDVRLALGALSRLGEQGARREEERALRIAADGAEFSLQDEARSLARHGTLRRLLLRLVDARLSEPGSSVSWESLFGAGWPSERANAEAAKNRVKVAVSSLRGMGLREVLLHDGSGYLLDPAVAVRVVGRAPR